MRRRGRVDGSRRAVPDAPRHRWPLRRRPTTGALTWLADGRLATGRQDGPARRQPTAVVVAGADPWPAQALTGGRRQHRRRDHRRVLRRHCRADRADCRAVSSDSGRRCLRHGARRAATPGAPPPSALRDRNPGTAPLSVAPDDQRGRFEPATHVCGAERAAPIWAGGCAIAHPDRSGNQRERSTSQPGRAAGLRVSTLRQLVTRRRSYRGKRPSPP